MVLAVVAMAGGLAGSPPAETPALDVASLVPAPVELATPIICGSISVYDQEDVNTLCSPTTLAATPIVLSTCPQTVSGSVRLETDLACSNTSGLIVGSDNTVIDLNGHRIVCTGSGYGGSCQGGSVEVGVDSNNHDNVHVFSHVDGGTISGFDRGVFVRTLSDNAKVKQLTITGPTATSSPRPTVFGVLVEGNHCQDGIVRIGGGSRTGNEVENQTTGIRVNNANCVYVGANTVHDNTTSDPNVLAAGIRLRNSSTNHVRGNVVTANGSGVTAPPPDSGIVLNATTTSATTDNLLVENQVNSNDGEGIATDSGAAGNDILNNQMFFNTQFDAYSDPSVVNNWNNNNRCHTQTAPQPPPGVCNPGE